MKTTLLILFAAAALLLPTSRGFTADATPPAISPATAQTELDDLVTKVKAKLANFPDGKVKESDLADELKQFDALLAKHKSEKTEDVAKILFMKGTLYLEVFENETKGAELLSQLKTDFPDTAVAKEVDSMLAEVKQMAAAKKAQEAQEAEAKKISDALVVGSKFPDFQEKDVVDKPVSIAGLKGKVVLVDFWATWCPPCVAEIPNVLKTYEKHHAEGFEIVGISLDQDKTKLTSFTADKKMAWQQFFDGENKLATKYGIITIPTSYLLDGAGNILAKGDDLRGEGLETAVAKALAKK